jgi:hypothetical protein
MEIAGSSEMAVTVYQSAWLNFIEDFDFNPHCPERVTLKSFPSEYFSLLFSVTIPSVSIFVHLPSC